MFSDSNTKFAQLAQTFRELNILGFGYSSRQDAKTPSKTYGHFDPFGHTQGRLQEKSFLDSSRSLGMTGLGPSPLRLGVPSTLLETCFAGDLPAFGCGAAALGLCGEDDSGESVVLFLLRPTARGLSGKIWFFSLRGSLWSGIYVNRERLRAHIAKPVSPAPNISKLAGSGTVLGSTSTTTFWVLSWLFMSQ